MDSALEHHRAGRLVEAEARYRQVLTGQPLHPAAWLGLGVVAHQLGRHEEALAHLTRARDLDTANPAVYLNLGEALRALRRGEAARACAKRALELRPDYPEAHNNLGLVEKEAGHLERAEFHFTRATALRPDFAEAHHNLARTLKVLGRSVEAVNHYRRAVDLRPSELKWANALVFTLHFDPEADDRALRRELERWQERHAVPLRSSWRPHPNPPDPARRLRVGYVSGDFRQHPVAFFLYPLLRAHDSRQVEVFAYADVQRPDAVTAGFRGLVDHWRDVTALSDAELAGQVRADGVDLLVDLSMHAAHSRLRTFARRPAPVQISWLAYPGSTGLAAMDLRLTDARMDPPDEEETPAPPGGAPLRLPDAWCCYHPLGETPAVSDLPALRPGSDGALTFGCLNSFAKVNDAVLERWARLLAGVPGSRLLLHAPAEESVHRRVRARLAEAGGVAGERVEFVPVQGRTDYLGTYGRIDVGLDPFPFNGMTTTCEAMWQGVPVLTLPGRTPGSRVGASLLGSVGLVELVAASEAESFALARTLAADLPRLASLRGGLRERMATSPLMDAPRFARHVEVAYRAAWTRWCQQQGGRK